MTPWLKEFTIDVGDGETFAPFDADAPMRVTEWAAEQSYDVATDPETLLDRFGIGTWKYVPDVAEKLLTTNGFTRNAEGMWLLPDGTPWKITIIAAPDEVDVQRLAIGAQDQWKKFGIDVAIDSLERDSYYQRQNLGQFEITSTWNPFTVTADGDLWQGLNNLHSRFFTPVGTSTAGNGSQNIIPGSCRLTRSSSSSVRRAR